MGAHAADAAVVVAAEEAIQAIGGAHAEERGRRVVDDAVEGAGVAERRVDRSPDAFVGGEAKRGTQRVHRVRPASRLGPADAV